jgi:ubiquinone/menaquinone biosynthesis C-methylase UbiE
MSTATYRNYSGSAAELYQDFFVPSIAVPASRELLRAARLEPGERVVDIACGTGVIARAAAEQVGPTGTVNGVDIAPDMLAIARATPAAGAPIEWHEADAASLPLPDGSYDVALCQMGLMFMEDRTGALAELHRVLAPGGRVVVNTPGRVVSLFEAMEQSIADHIDPQLGAFVGAVFSMPDPEVLAGLLRDAGFTAVWGREYTATFDLPAPAEFLWNYINLTPMGPLVAEAPEAARIAMERQVVDAWTPYLVDGRVTLVQPMALAGGERSV